MNQNHGELVGHKLQTTQGVVIRGSIRQKNNFSGLWGPGGFPEKDMGTVIAITSRNEICSIPDKLFKLFPRKLLYPGEKMMVGKD